MLMDAKLDVDGFQVEEMYNLLFANIWIAQSHEQNIGAIIVCSVVAYVWFPLVLDKYWYQANNKRPSTSQANKAPNKLPI